MRIYTKAGDLAFKTFDFPDGQPHFKLETFDRDFTSATVEMAIKSPSDLLLLGLVVDTLRSSGFGEIQLDVRYLLGARMDRALSSLEPYTLQVVARWINSLGFSKVRILDVHSEVATRLIRNSENVLPVNMFEQIVIQFPHVTLVIPDKGAVDRVLRLSRGPMGYVRDVLYCTKERDPQTGALTNFKVDTGSRAPFTALIVDDICDGGGTFVGLAKELRKAGAKNVYLFVTHGVFSKGTPLEGINHIFTTDSYCPTGRDMVTVIPISMKEMM